MKVHGSAKIPCERPRTVSCHFSTVWAPNSFSVHSRDVISLCWMQRPALHIPVSSFHLESYGLTTALWTEIRFRCHCHHDKKQRGVKMHFTLPTVCSVNRQISIYCKNSLLPNYKKHDNNKWLHNVMCLLLMLHFVFPVFCLITSKRHVPLLLSFFLQEIPACG